MKPSLIATAAIPVARNADDGFDAYSVESFCARHGISRAYFYLLIKRQQAPRIMKLGARTLITREAAAAWRSQMESATIQAA